VSNENENPVSCPIPTGPDLSKLTVVELAPAQRLPDYRAACERRGGKAAR